MSTSARRRGLALTASALALVLAACGSGFDDGGDSPSGPATDTTDADGGVTSGGGSGSGLEILIASSGAAETKAVEDAVAAWSATSGIEGEVRVASDLNQELAQGFAAGSPPDIFYVGTDAFAGLAANGSIKPYVDDLANKGDFYPTLMKSFTYEGTAYCAPKDFSTLALVINDELWSAAGLTEADYPTDWAGLQAVSEKLAAGTAAPLAFGPEWHRIGVFMAQAGGALVDGDTAVVDSPANAEALTYVKSLMDAGLVKYPADIGTGWGGEAFGSQAAAMTIEGNWVIGALRNDFPDVAYTVVELPAGPAGKGTLQFTNCWGVAADSELSSEAVSLVEFLTSNEQQMEFAKAFGVMPSVSTVAEEWTAEFPEQAAFLAGADYAQGVPPVQGIGDVLGDFNAQLETLATSDPAAILASVQGNLVAILP